MMNKLLFIWIASQTTTEDMWLAFKDKIGQLLEWKATVSQWKEKMVQLTHVLNDFFYRIPLKEETSSSVGERSQTLASRSSPLKSDSRNLDCFIAHATTSMLIAFDVCLLTPAQHPRD
jgi:hypothetical protein